MINTDYISYYLKYNGCIIRFHYIIQEKFNIISTNAYTINMKINKNYKLYKSKYVNLEKWPKQKIKRSTRLTRLRNGNWIHYVIRVWRARIKPLSHSKRSRSRPFLQRSERSADRKQASIRSPASRERDDTADTPVNGSVAMATTSSRHLKEFGAPLATTTSYCSDDIRVVTLAERNHDNGQSQRMSSPPTER